MESMVYDVKQLITSWGKTLDKNHIFEEYPRPMMVRDSYTNLNGEWDYTITKQKSDAGSFVGWEGKIVVPFSPEAYLSGVNRQLQPGEYLWYRRSISLPADYTEGKRVLLHFGAVDQRCAVYVNHICVTKHAGGYLPFEADITDALLREKEGELVVCVRDDSDASYHSKGKQALKRGGMFYTAQSGIWQSVWMECVPWKSVHEVVCHQDADKGEVSFQLSVNCSSQKDNFSADQKPIDLQIEIFEAEIDQQIGLKAEIYRNGTVPKPQKIDVTLLKTEKQIESADLWRNTEINGTAHGAVTIKLRIDEAKRHMWTPQTPYLYNYRIQFGEDNICGYFALRTFSVEADEHGVMRMCLNHLPYFQKGVLDQGYWPDGLYTPPCDAAMIYDIVKMKELGFNMLRKHIKIEPQRWYYHCDRLGMIVWQDMINGGSAYHFWFVTYLATAFNMFNYRIIDNCYDLLSRRDKRGREEFKMEMEQTVRTLQSHPCIGTWVIFNEGWGQFDAKKMTKRLRALDDSRVIDSASGWFDQRCGDLRSQHYYFFKLVLQWEQKRATVLSEFGGFPFKVEGHTCCEKVYGYHPCTSIANLQRAYQNLMQKTIQPQIENGLSATVYTQLSDVEEEVNGILTYDREVCKHENL